MQVSLAATRAPGRLPGRAISATIAPGGPIPGPLAPGPAMSPSDRTAPIRSWLARALLAGGTVLAAAGAQAQYKWTDANGQTGYGDQPPKDAAHVEALAPLSVGAEENDALARLPYEIRRVARSFPVILYTIAACGPCDDARAFLKARNVPFFERTVTSREDLDAYHKLGGTDLLPTVAVGRQMLRGFESGAWSEALATAGYPSGIPLPHDWQWPAPTALAPAATAPAAAADSDAAASR